MSNSIYGDEATKLDDNLFARLAKMNPERWKQEYLEVPVISSYEAPIVKGEYPVMFADFNYDTVRVPLESVKYIEPDPHNVPADRMMGIWNKFENKAMRNIDKLIFNDIPVFNIKRGVYPEYRKDMHPEIVFSYQIPEQLMYKSFYVLYDFTEAFVHAKQYAMQQVQKVIDEY